MTSMGEGLRAGREGNKNIRIAPDNQNRRQHKAARRTGVVYTADYACSRARHRHRERGSQ